MTKKKVNFEGLKAGTFFRYKRILYIKDDGCCSVRLSNGVTRTFGDEELVTPVKLNLIVK